MVASSGSQTGLKPLVAVKTWEELHFTPILEVLGMNPRAIATAQITPSNCLIESLSE